MFEQLCEMESHVKRCGHEIEIVKIVLIIKTFSLILTFKTFNCAIYVIFWIQYDPNEIYRLFLFKNNYFFSKVIVFYFNDPYFIKELHGNLK